MLGSDHRAAERAPGRTYRAELQGLRAVAALLVVVYHVWLGRVSGGVDVFFLISGFLVTGQLVRAAGRGRIDLRATWSRTARRLLPAAVVVLGTTLVAGALLLPENRWSQTVREVIASALFVENWQLASDSTDYYAQHEHASVVQHFWSLSIQGQFYLLWPLLVLVVTLLRGSLSRVLLAVFAVSLGFSVWLTALDQPLAYFHTATRIWEFAFGGLLALVVSRIDLSRPLRTVLGWAGLLGLLVCGLVLDVGAAFPGYLALWPTACAAAVIVAGATGSRFGADRFLSAEPLRYLGNLSYSLYLWHWPVLVGWLVIKGRGEVGMLGGLAVIGASLLLAAATHHLVEEPVRKSRWRARTLVPLLLVPLLAATAFLHPAGPREVAAQVAATDFAAIDGQHCERSPRNQDLEICHGPAGGTPAKRVVLVGDSHVQQYIAALEPIAQRRNWQLVAMLKGACPYSTRSEKNPGDQSCVRWNEDATTEILDLRPDFVFTLATRNVQVGLTEVTPPGFVERWRQLDDAGIPVVAVRDNPRYSFSVLDCVQVHGPAARCGAPRSELLSPVPPYAHLDVPGNVSFLDFSDELCTEDQCPPVKGDLLVNFDDNHVSATFMRSLSEVVEQALDAVTEAPIE
ncbi:acyltransferase family protein [Lentzea albida]|uniref:Peptidoglycan/LPS O-acetylase OafA/YrhL, contains acyltransferase and SGNH-hydrolase domains n=1 Tax=Lentzea albida TaxID=65499 RepID=A0A1H9WAB0_9PSEU|nr:acyltransferase family protein [Lentzea albida]SES30711.1 Peptidoglycan/LPS O-acetylase OafA/YrhL, contains acyltransferase and SGNH-hydrolase domains [Lentzea albida]